jgi:hypothetical protein
MADGLHFNPLSATGPHLPSVSVILKSPEIGGLLDQLVTEDLASADEDGAIVMDWEQVHELVRSPVYASSLPLLELPPTLSVVPRLQSRGSLTDPHFAIGIAGWTATDGTPVAIQALVGSLAKTRDGLGLLPAPVWRLLRALNASPNVLSMSELPGPRAAIGARSAASLSKRGRTSMSSSCAAWLSRPRSSISSSVRHELPDRRSLRSTPASTAPPTDGWNFSTRPRRFPTTSTSPPRPERCTSHCLSRFAAEAIDPDQFAEARKSAGIEFDRFRPFVVRDSLGYPAQVGLKIDTPRGDAFEQLFATDDELGTFISNLEQRLRDGLQLLAWQEFEFELDGEATAHLETLQSVLEEHSKPPIVVRHENVFDLASYSERVVGIGKAQPFISAYIVKKSDSEGWFSSNLLALLKFRPNSAAADVTLPLTPETLPEVREAIADAKGARATSLQLPGSAVPGVRLMRLTLPVPSADAPCLRSANSVSRVGGRISSQPVTLSRLRFCWAMAWLEQT